jgi:alpha-L-arabinofuranosidase
LGTVNVFGCTSFLVWSGVPRRKDAVEMGMKLRNLKMAFAAVAGIVVLAGATYPVQGASGPGNGVTHLRVTSQVILPGVTRLGINLGGQNYYDSGQIMKNLLFRNPGFEGMSYRSILHCQSGGPARCIDVGQGFVWPAGFWDGASFEVLDGTAAGRKGRVLTSGPSGGGYGLGLDSGKIAVGAGDWLAVKKDFPGDPAAGWWPTLTGGARLEAERKDLSPATSGRQALRIEASGPGQSAQIKSYFDTLDGFTFVRLRGRYRLSFRAKALSGSMMVHLHMVRIIPSATSNLEQDVRIGPGWADYSQEFTANEGDGPAGPVEVSFTVTGGEMLLDDVDLEQTSGDAANRTGFRDEVVETLRELRPGVLRLMSGEELGSTVDNLLATPMARQRSGYSSWFTTEEDIPVGIPEFLELCQEVGAEPWIVAPTAMSQDEARKLAEYLAGGQNTAGGALRIAGGRREPWTRTFRTIHIELGNETWNGGFKGESMEDGAAYGRRANQVFAALRAAAGADAGRFDLAVGTQAVNPGRNTDLLAAASQANTLTIAPYLMHSVTKWSNDDELYGPLLAQPEQMSREGIVQATQSSAGGRQLAVYEVNLHTTEGTAPQAVLDRFTPSAAAGLAVTGHMLRMMRDHGVRDQMIFALPQFHFRRGDGTFVRLWGSVVEMGANGRMRPQFLAEALANRVIGGDLVRVEVTGENPTHDQAEGNDGVQLKGVHEIDAYGFQEGKVHGLIVFNYGLHEARRVSLEAPGLATNSRVNLWRLTSSGPGATNEETPQVKVKEERFGGGELTLGPCSMAVLQWQE